MYVNTAAVGNRREVRYERLEDLLHEVEQLAVGDVRTLGNWTFGQVLAHLAEVMHASIDGAPYRASWPRRVLAQSFSRGAYLHRAQPAGFQLPAKAAETLVPRVASVEAGLAALRRAIHRLRGESERAEHPLLGVLTEEEWDQCHLRHAELHLSFILPLYDTIGLVQSATASGRE